jgi:hypothetical protein
LHPEFHWSCKINSQLVRVYNINCPYDIIIGHDLLSKTGMALDLLQWRYLLMALQSQWNLSISLLSLLPH